MEKLEEGNIPIGIRILSGDEDGRNKLDRAVEKAASQGQATVIHKGYEVTIRRAFASTFGETVGRIRELAKATRGR